MTADELRKKLEGMTPEEFRKFKGDIGGEGSTIDWYVDGFVRKSAVLEPVYAEYFKLPTEQDRVNQATISSSEAAKVSADAARESVRISWLSLYVSAGAMVIALASLVATLIQWVRP